MFLCFSSTNVKCTTIKAITFVLHLSTGHVASDNYTWLSVSCVWAAGPLQSGSVSLQAEEAESLSGLWSSGCAGVLFWPTRHRRWTTPTQMLCSKSFSITTTPTLFIVRQERKTVKYLYAKYIFFLPTTVLMMWKAYFYRTKIFG